MFLRVRPRLCERSYLCFHQFSDTLILCYPRRICIYHAQAASGSISYPHPPYCTILCQATSAHRRSAALCNQSAWEKSCKCNPSWPIQFAKTDLDQLINPDPIVTPYLVHLVLTNFTPKSARTHKNIAPLSLKLWLIESGCWSAPNIHLNFDHQWWLESNHTTSYHCETISDHRNWAVFYGHGEGLQWQRHAAPAWVLHGSNTRSPCSAQLLPANRRQSSASPHAVGVWVSEGRKLSQPLRTMVVNRGEPWWTILRHGGPGFIFWQTKHSTAKCCKYLQIIVNHQTWWTMVKHQDLPALLPSFRHTMRVVNRKLGNKRRATRTSLDLDAWEIWKKLWLRFLDGS